MPEINWSAIADFARDRTAEPAFREWLGDLLVELCRIDTTPNPDPARAAAGESAIFDIIEREIRTLCGQAVKLQRVPIDPDIESDPYYTVPYHMAAEDGSVPGAAQAYAHRSNLLAIFDGDPAKGRPAVYNAHVDTVAPHVPPRREGAIVHGRGAADDKGCVAALIAQIRLLREIENRFHLTVAPTVYQFVIEEETGGNGSLSAVRDNRWAGWDVVINEVTGNVPMAGCRGAFWFKVELSAPQGRPRLPVETIPHVVLEMEREGRKIKAESRHPLFQARHVQTNYGILGPYGRHPSTVNAHVALVLSARVSANPQRVRIRLAELLDAGIARYVQQYGDKTKTIDAGTGRPKVARHYELTDQSRDDRLIYRLDVYGRSGHMAAIDECDNAITKLAYAMEGVLQLAAQFPGLEPAAWLADLPPDRQRTIALEGGQGFVPTHKMADLQARLAAAARKGVIRYLDGQGMPHDLIRPSLTCGKLHNEAYAGNPDGPAMQAFDFAYQLLSKPPAERAGWQASCDARIFARAGHDVIVFGPGRTEHAHADDEQIDLGELAEGAVIEALAALKLGAAS